MNGIELITAERRRQIDVEGWTPEHDDGHDFQELSKAALCYTDYAILVNLQGHDEENFWEEHAAIWPWDKKWWKPSSDPVRNFVKAGALLAADIDRLKRLGEPKGDCSNCKHPWRFHVPYGAYPNGCQVVVEQDGERCHCPCEPS